MRRLARAVQALMIAIGILFGAAAAHAADKITIGLVGGTSLTHWPIHIGLTKGYYAAENITLDLIHTRSSGAVMQQLAAGSLDATLSAGLVDPIYAIDKGAPISIIRLEIQLPPYAIEAKSKYSKLEDLKGKIIMADAPKGITRIYIDSMLAAHGIKPNQVDYVYTGSTGARFAALKTGGVDATILLPPFSFSAEAQGFRNIGLVADYRSDLPFTGAAVNNNWATKHQALLKRFLTAHNKSMAFFLDPKNRQESIDIMVAASKMKPDVIGKTYDFLHAKPYMEGTGKISRKKMGALLAALKQLGDLKGSTDLKRFVLPSIAQLTD